MQTFLCSALHVLIYTMLKRSELTTDQQRRFYNDLRSIAGKENVPMGTRIEWIADIPQIAEIEAMLTARSKDKVISLRHRLRSRNY